jgi:hypothetical protein
VTSTAEMSLLPKALAATLDHIRLLRAKQETLTAAQIAAEEQLLHRVGRMHAAGDLDQLALIEFYESFSPAALPGFTKRWDHAIAFSTVQLYRTRTHLRHLKRNAPNMPDGTWQGTWPVEDGPVPIDGTPVVYVLYDAASHPCYVGSSEKLKGRLQAHDRDGKPYTRWTASRCEDREAAYQLEDRLLAQYMPYLNKRQGR